MILIVPGFLDLKLLLATSASFGACSRVASVAACSLCLIFGRI